MSGNSFSVIGKLAVFGFIGMVMLAIVGGCMIVGYQNKGVELQNQDEAARANVELAYDTMWKKIAQQAQVTDAAKEGFKEVYEGMMEARYDGQNPAFLWLQEQNPNFDMSMFRVLMNTIDGERESLKRAQQVVLDIRVEYNNLRGRFPSSLVCGGMPDLPEYTLLSSSRSKEVVRTGRDDDVDVFGKGTTNTSND